MALKRRGDRVGKSAYELCAGLLVGENLEICAKHLIGLADRNGEREPIASRRDALRRDAVLREEVIHLRDALGSRLDVFLDLFAFGSNNQ